MQVFTHSFQDEIVFAVETCDTRDVKLFHMPFVTCDQSLLGEARVIN